MDKEALKYYKIIGQVQSAISKSEHFDEALEAGLKIILDNCHADYSIIWYVDSSEKEVLHPYYWIGPKDITSQKFESGKSIVGKVYETEHSIRLLNFEESIKENTEIGGSTIVDMMQDFNEHGIDIGSMLCVPLTNSTRTIGCIQFINKKETPHFTEEEADICEMLSMIVAIAIEEENLLKSWVEKKVILQAKNIKKEFASGETVTKALKGINLDVYEGEFLALLGESGCGKTTLLNILGGMDQPTSGELVFMDENIAGLSMEELTKYRRDNIGFVFQSYNLMPNLNAKQNLDLIAELVKDPLDSKEVLDLVGLKERMEHYPAQLSGGQQQRVSIARALVKRPKIIMADEPTAALDYATSIEVLSAFEKVVETGTTLVMVTHNEEITRMADRVVRIRDGKMYEVTINNNPVDAKELVW